MSGHSKWSTIKRQKAITDARRSAAFTKLARQITIAARLGGGDPVMNFRLRLAIDKAKGANVPNDNIDRAIKAGTGEGKEGLSKEVLYEGFGPGGVAIMVEAITDNSNRTAAEVRGVFTKFGGTLGGQNSVGWMFIRGGLIQADVQRLTKEQREVLELSLIDAGATDVRLDGDQLAVTTSLEDLAAVQHRLQETVAGAASDVEYLPTTTTTVSDSDREKLHTLLEHLDELDDVTHVSTNEA